MTKTRLYIARHGKTMFNTIGRAQGWSDTVSYTHLRAHETRHDLVCRLLLEKKKKQISEPTRPADPIIGLRIKNTQV